MKRKVTFAFIAMASAIMSMAYADGYGTLVFKSVTGESYSVDAEGLEIYFKDGTLTFNNDGRSIPVASLVSMEFSDNLGVEKIVSGSDGPVAVFSVDAVKIGEYTSLKEAYSDLPQGIYVVRRSNGKTFKISVGQ